MSGENIIENVLWFGKCNAVCQINLADTRIKKIPVDSGIQDNVTTVTQNACTLNQYVLQPIFRHFSLTEDTELYGRIILAF